MELDISFYALQVFKPCYHMTMSDKRYRRPIWLRRQYKERERTMADIAEQCDVTPRTIQIWLNKHDIDTRSVGSQPSSDKLSNADWLRKKFEEEDMTRKEIGDIVDVTPVAVTYWLKKHDIQSHRITP